MGLDFIRYRPDVEVAEPTFDESLKTILDRASHYTTASVTSEGQAVRSAHATGYGLARAEVEILGGRALPYAQGIYAGPGHHEAMVRFSNGNGHMGPDAWLGAVCGIGLKIFDIDGPTLLEDEADSRTFDYALINHRCSSSTNSSTTSSFKSYSWSRSVSLPSRTSRSSGNVDAFTSSCTTGSRAWEPSLPNSGRGMSSAGKEPQNLAEVFGS